MRMSFLSCMTGGSSPLARGLHQGHLSGRPGPGIIPARAGFTQPYAPSSQSSRDHPRSRGVYVRRRWSMAGMVGSSPLARGLLRPCQEQVPVRADHPRSRGVYWRSVMVPRLPPGSSPLARGLRRLLGRHPHLGRIIPARAGFTATTGPPSTPGSDHPRSRGVYAAGLSDRQITMGSSPLARGLLALRRRDDDSLRVGLLVWWQFLRGFLGWCS